MTFRRAIQTTILTVLLAGNTHAEGTSSIETYASDYGWRSVNQDQDFSVALDRFHLRLSHFVGNSRDTLSVSVSYDRIHMSQIEDGHSASPFGFSPSEDHIFYQLPIELHWRRSWTPSWDTTFLLEPRIVGEEVSNKNRYPVLGGFYFSQNGLSVGAGRFAVSGRSRWWPLVGVNRTWYGVHIDGLFPRHIYLQKEIFRISAIYEGATYSVTYYDSSSFNESIQPLYFSQLNLGGALTIGGAYGLSTVVEIGRAIERRFEGPVSEADGQTIDDGWYTRATVSWMLGSN